MDLIEAIRTRRSCAVSVGHIERADLHNLIELAMWAPNHHLTQPWRFTVLTGDAPRRLAARWAQRQVDLNGSVDFQIFEMEVKKAERAPVHIVVSVRTDPDPVVAQEDFAAGAAAIQNLLLAAHARGMAAIWRTGKMVQDAEIKRFLELAPTDRIVGIVHLGRDPVKVVSARSRDVDAAITWVE